MCFFFIRPPEPLSTFLFTFPSNNLKMLLRSICPFLSRSPCLGVRWPVRTIVQIREDRSFSKRVHGPPPRRVSGYGGTCQLRSLLVKYFGLFGGLEPIHGKRDFIFHYTMGNTKVRILVASKSRNPRAKTITALPTKVLETFLVDASRPGISAGFMLSRRPLRHSGDIIEKNRSVLMSKMPLHINPYFEHQIIQRFMHTIVKGVLWERRQSTTSRLETWLLDPDHE